MFCEGQLLPISENETLFQLIGTTYGGDGQSTFALPDLRGRLPLHLGNGFVLAETGGAEESHADGVRNAGTQHAFSVASATTRGDSSDPAATSGRVTPASYTPYISDSAEHVAQSADALRRQEDRSRTTTSSRTFASTSSFRCSAIFPSPT